MSTNVEPKPAVSGSGNVVAHEFEGCVPKTVTVAKVMDADENQGVWKKLYVAAAIANQGEAEKKKLRCGVYTYLAQNGTSPSGGYRGRIVTGSGVALRASEIPAAAGMYSIRQFARANAEESLRFFRMTRCLETDTNMVVKCETMGVPTFDVVGLVDWFDSASGLTPTERDVQRRMKNFGLVRSRRARSGHDLEEVRDHHMDEALDAQGPERSVMPPSSSGW